jgi:hypothetical protein
MTEKSNMEDLFVDFDILSEMEDTVDLEQVVVPEDDYFEATEEDIDYPTYGGTPEIKYNTYTYKTAGGKTVEVYHEPMGTFWSIRFKEGGQLPQELAGKFTHENDARQAVEVYLARNS